jgi:hypothetical protein
VQARAVWVLAKVVHWLQQNPCKELLTLSALDPDSCVWFTVANQLTALVQEVKNNCSLSIQLDCCQQLEQAAGECMSSFLWPFSSMITMLPFQSIAAHASGMAEALLLCKWLCLLVMCKLSLHMQTCQECAVNPVKYMHGADWQAASI